ncbi:hydroxymethylpyrimidine/phosphomethylpyrimidine kinase [Campylobacter concisus]|uniref:hydroxymethylpyrimidine/phosphomethylpyrimidine kinase n=1 Tax=Campylobacter concisus TaxID=199 RepID=UPI000CD91A4C|nr:hydroxymethylpyrimidine/phosphomethylpyrimidine kinase [Campylobacter concisus]QPH88427.1 hydroxymethylpyrimidine/phosphomethylpyrimidine kinase [Campylobacter concisus]QPI03374.1 hydroxymethylpyrimidine/phosphomethylpyrimidine kinase [Campylobacter concisus]
MKNILIIAGSDSVGGAGVQADIKTCEAFSCYAATAITALTAQNTNGVSNIFATNVTNLNEQIKMVDEELNIDAIKVGMLFNKELISCVGFWLEKFHKQGIKIVIDPVCVAKSGSKLLEDDAIVSLKELFKFADIITPNIDEAKVLELDSKNLPCDMILKRSMVAEICEDTLFKKNGDVLKFNEPLIKPEIMHGAGCSFASALACLLANGHTKEEAIKLAKRYILNAIKNAITTKFGKRLLNHKVGISD